MHKWIWWASLLGLISLAYVIQSISVTQDNVVNATHITELLLATGSSRYGVDYLEFSPPMIMFLNMVPVLFAKYTGFNTFHVMILYILSLTFISLTCCYFLITLLFAHRTLTAYFMLSMSALILLFLPACFFAEREHFAIILILPYLYASAVRLEHKTLPRYFALFIGILAGIGFSIKPFFLTTFVFIELYLALKKPAFWQRPECLGIMAVSLIYLSYVYVFFPQYVHHLVPLVVQFYGVGIQESWYVTFSRWPVQFSFACLLFYLLSDRKNTSSSLGTIFFIALIGFIFSFVIPRAGWFYHAIPAFSLACLLLAFCLTQLSQTFSTNSGTRWQRFGNIGVIAGFAFAFFVFPVFHTYLLTSYGLEAKNIIGKSDVLAFFKHHSPNNTFTCFSQHLDYQQYTVYSDAKFVGASPNLWWEMGAHRLLKQAADQQAVEKIQRARNELINAVAQNLIRAKPRFVLIDKSPMPTFFAFKENYLADFLQNKEFAVAWRAYGFYKRVGIYEVYERKMN